MHCPAAGAAAWAPAEKHPLIVADTVRQASAVEDSRDLGARQDGADSATTEDTYVETPARVSEALVDMPTELYRGLASLPRGTHGLHHWLVGCSEEVRCVILGLAHVVRTLSAERDPDRTTTMERTVAEAMDETLPGALTAEDTLAEHASVAAPLVPPPNDLTAVYWLVAHAQAVDHAALELPANETPPRAVSDAASDTTIPSNASTDRDSQSEADDVTPPPVELASMIPAEARPPTLLPRPLADVRGVHIDRYGFLYGMSVADYWRESNGSNTQPSPPPTDEPPPLPLRVGIETSQTRAVPAPASVWTVAPAPATTETSSVSAMSAPDDERVPQTVPRLLRHVRDVYDQQQTERQARWDAFLEQLGARRTCTHPDAPQSVWHDTFAALRAPDHATKGARSDWRRFQALCESGVPMCYRPAVWSECTRARELAEPGRYAELLASDSSDRQIDLDVRRTMPTNLFFGGRGPGVDKLRRLLGAYARYNTATGYCQGMNNLAAVLLLTYPDEEDAFWAFAGMVDTILPTGFFASDMRVAQADQDVLLALIHTGLPRLSAHMRALDIELRGVTYAWFLSLFTSCLPTETLFRVWDLLVIDGNVMLFRIAYAILVLKSSTLLATRTAAAFYGALRVGAAHLFDADEVVATCVSLRTSIRPADIAARRNKILARMT